MPLTVTGLREATHPYRAEFMGEEVHGNYRPANFTPEFEDLISGAEADESKSRSRCFLEAFALVVASWDLLDKPGGKPWPITPEKLAVLPSALLVAVLKAIGEAQNPPATTSGS